MIRKRLRDVFVEILRDRGITSIGALSKRFRKSDDKLRDMALAVFHGLGAVVELPRPTNVAWDLEGKRVEGSIYAYVPSCMVSRFRKIIDREDIRVRIPEWPYIVVDLMYWNRHTQSEKGKLCLQLNQAYSLIKERFTGKELVVTWAGDEFRRMFYGPIDRITVYEGSTADFLAGRKIGEVVLLDPWAEEELSKDDLRVRAFIIGGIVDTSGSKRGTTPKIGRNLEEHGISVRRRKITLRGDVIGVPDRINRIIGILLRIMEGVPMDRAVYEFQEPRHARWRLRRELPKKAFEVMVNGRRVKAVSMSLLDEYSKWLKIRERDFIKVARELGLIVIDGRTQNV